MRWKPAIEAAFCSAVLATFVGSMTPAQVLEDTRKDVISVVLLLDARTLATTTAPSAPELGAICRSGSDRSSYSEVNSLLGGAAQFAIELR